MRYLTVDRLAAAGDFEPVEQRHWFGTTELPGEPTGHPALRITPDVHADQAPLRTGVHHQVRYTGYWTLIHVPTGHAVTAGHWLPLAWIRRFARLLATSSIDWDRLTGDTTLVTHPQHATVRTISERVLDCWRRGSPVAARLLASLSVDQDQYYGLSCANPQCEDDFAVDDPPASLTYDGPDGQDELSMPEHQLGELYEFARTCGWSRLADGSDHWLCETCTGSHQPAPEQIARCLATDPKAVMQEMNLSEQG